jgi:TolB-like protein/thioredoxin-like negative regulator of GroEL
MAVNAIMEASFGAAQEPLASNLRPGRARANDPKTAGAPMAVFGRLWPLVLHRHARMSRVQPSPGDRLDSWKEIAAYLNRGVRTVRRWEAVEGLPVHRQLHRTQGSVYAFKSEIETWRKTAARQPVRRPAAPGPARHPIKSIAVLPFTNLSTDPENAYFADGLTDEVTADLSKVRALRVISRTSAMTFKGSAKDVKTIAAELGVRYVLEGSVRRAGGWLRITARLIDASTDAHLWADKYDGPVADVFAFQERLARTIVGALEMRLSTDEERRLAERPVATVHAYECYLRARQEIWRWRKDAIDRAVRLLHEGLETDGDSAGLYATLGLAHLQYREAGIDVGPGPLQEADACAQKVFALAPASLAGLQLRGWIDYSRGRVQEAVRDLKAALEIDPNSADTLSLLGNCYLISGKVTAARPLIARLLAVDPLTPVNRCMPGFADIMEGRFAPAVDPYRQMLEMDPGNPMARLFYIWVLILNDRIEEVASIIDGFSDEVRGTIPARIASVLAHAVTGNAAGLHAAVSPEVEGVATSTDLFPRFLAQGYALAGIPDRAMHWLEIAIGRGFINYPFLAQHDPFFESLRAHPRFVQLTEIARARWEGFEA